VTAPDERRPPGVGSDPRPGYPDLAREQAEHVRFEGTTRSDTEDRTPWIKVAVSVEISGEWITEDMLAHAARQLVASLTQRLGMAADDANAEAARRRGPEGPGPS
jgi:hypothetical protein